MSEGGRLIQEGEEVCDLKRHMDAADLRWGGTVSRDLSARVAGEVEDLGVGVCKERRDSITRREMKAFRIDRKSVV